MGAFVRETSYQVKFSFRFVRGILFIFSRVPCAGKVHSCLMPSLPDRIQLPILFDPAALRRDLAALGSSDWISHFVTQNYTGDWSVLPLRGKAGATHPVMMIYSDPGCTDFANTPYLAACPYYQEVRAMELGQQHGFPFEPADVEAALQNARRAWMDSRKV